MPDRIIPLITLDDEEEDADVIPIEPDELNQSLRLIHDQTIQLDSSDEEEWPSSSSDADSVEILDVTRASNFTPEPDNPDVKPQIEEGYFRGPFNKRMVVLDQDEPLDEPLGDDEGEEVEYQETHPTGDHNRSSVLNKSICWIQ